MLYHESETRELKASFGEWKEIIISLSAFANKSGGTVIVGLNDNGTSGNLTIGKETLSDFANKVKLNTDPVLYPSFNVKTHGLGVTVEITIPESENKPVFAFDRAYIRVGSSNQKLSSASIKEMVREYSTADFDSMLLTPLDWNELDLTLVESADQSTDPQKAVGFLEKNGLTQKEGMLNATYLSYCNRNSRFPNAIVKAARFKGNDMVGFIDMHDFNSGLIRTADEVIEFIKRHVNRAVSIGDRAKRIEQWDYPIPAIREAVINALVHRDYADSGNIQIRLFDSRLEIWSPGLLPKNLSIKKLLTESRSIPRNRKLAWIFYHHGLIENWGTGFLSEWRNIVS